VFGLSIHLDIELGQAGEGGVVNLVILVVEDMFKVDSDGEFLLQHSDGADELACLMDSGTLCQSP
jgi:hypothetical protein